MIKYLDSKRVSGIETDRTTTHNRGTVTTDGSYTVITFLQDGKFTPTSSFNVEYLVVAGGGGGGGQLGGTSIAGAGGGAGGHLSGTGHAVTSQAYTITVGAGGAGGVGSSGSSTDAGNGSNSVFDTQTAIGGGAAASANYDTPAENGGSGGGGISANTPNHVGGTGTVGQGNDGGDGHAPQAGDRGSAGGGGAGAAASNTAANKNGTAGGAGESNSITGSAVTRAGGGGGGAGGNSGGSAGAGGSGGGGAGAGNSAHGTAGTANTGGGGGGAGAAGATGYDGGSGGSGVVIIRFLTSGNNYETSTSDMPTNVQDNSIFVETDTARRYWFDVGAESNVELTTGAPFTTHSAGWNGRVYASELADLPNVGDVITGGKIYVGTSSGNVRLGLYSDSGSGTPQTLLAETASTAVGSAGAWQEIDFITPYTTTSTGKLHLGLQTDSSGSSFGYALNVINGRSNMVTSYSAFPTTFSGTSDNAPADLRAVVERPAAPTWTMNPTFEDDFSSDNWVDQDTEQQVTGGSLAYDPKRDGSNDASSYDLQIALGSGVNADNEKWFLQYVQNNTSVYSSGNGNRLWFGISDKPSSTAQNGTHQFIGLYQNFDFTSKYGAIGVDGGALPQSNTATVVPATGTDYYTRITRISSTSMRVQVWTGGYDQTVFYDETLTIASTLVDLRYIWIGNYISTHGGDSITGTIDDLKFYNGVTTPN